MSLKSTAANQLEFVQRTWSECDGLKSIGETVLRSWLALAGLSTASSAKLEKVALCKEYQMQNSKCPEKLATQVDDLATKISTAQKRCR